MVTTVVGGAMLPHAPQFFTMPPTEDRANVDRVRAVATKIGSKLRELKPDLWIIFSNDHAEQFFHSVAPPFTIHVGGSADGHFAGHDFHWDIPSAIGLRRRPRKRIASGRPRPQSPTGANQVWSYDFVFDWCANGQQLKCLTVKRSQEKG
jgi:hypothetical protein